MRVAVVGGGPAGMAAALWACRLGLEVTLYEQRECLGGQLLSYTLPIVDLPGFEGGAARLVQVLEHQLARVKAEIKLGVAVTGYDATTHHVIHSAGEDFVEALCYAPGLRVRQLHVPGESALPVLSVSEVVKEPDAVRSVVVIGGGDRAVEAACRMANAGKHVTLVHRGATFRARTSLARCLENTHVNVRGNTEVTSFNVYRDGFQVSLTGADCVFAQRVFVRIGMEPDWNPAIVGNPAAETVRMVGDATLPSHLRSLSMAFATANKTMKEWAEGE